VFQYRLRDGPEVGIDLEERARRIVETAVELAEEGGFEAVRLRDVASHAGVALGTLYRRFRSKEDLLIAALELETRDLERRVRQRPPKGADARERVAGFFATATRGLIRRPNLARALLKAAACGEPGLAKQVAAFHDRMEGMVVAALRGRAAPGEAQLEELKQDRVDTRRDGAYSEELRAPGDSPANVDGVQQTLGDGGLATGTGRAQNAERELAHSLTLVWFALLVGWSGGLHGQGVVIEHMSSCVELMLLGAESKKLKELQGDA
jgi:AcrR family transcriptional regulator